MADKKELISNAFKDKSSVTSQELASYFRKEDINATDESIRKRISRLKSSGFLVSIRQGVYALDGKPQFKPVSDTFMQKLAKVFTTAYPEINCCVWSSSWLYEFMIHQPARYFYFFETEPDMVETTFNLLKDNGINAWLNPDEQTMQLYVLGNKNAVIVKPLITRAPLIKSRKVNLPMLEKMLVDAWVDKKFFYFLQGSELSTIFNFAFSRFAVNYSRLLSYARRRGVEKEIEQYIKKHSNPNDTPFLND